MKWIIVSVYEKDLIFFYENNNNEVFNLRFSHYISKCAFNCTVAIHLHSTLILQFTVNISSPNKINKIHFMWIKYEISSR